MPAHRPEWTVSDARNGLPTLLIDGRAIHSTFDPLREAERAASEIPDGVGIVVLAGLGLGYVAEALARAGPDRRLIIVEADESAPGRISRFRDLSALYNNPKVTILAGGKPEAVQNALAGGPVGGVVHYFPWRPAVGTSPEWYGEVARIVEETSRRRAVNARTLERFGNLWIRNIAANVPHLPKALSLDDWAKGFEDLPALILAGGPSLENVLPHMKDLERRFLLLVVDTAVPALLRTGVKPDIVVAVDPQYWNTRHLDRCGDGVGDALVLAEAATHPTVFRVLRGRPLFTRTRFPLGTVLEDAVGLRGELKAGGSVATAAWDLARHLGCRPMVAAGLDLGFPRLQTHYAGSLSRERPHFFGSRLNPAEKTFYHALRDAHSHRTVDMAGRELLSDARMDVYHSWFCESTAALPHRNPGVLGDRGRLIPGMKIYGVKELLGYPERREEIDKRLRAMKTVESADGAEKRLDQAIESLRKALERILTLAETGKKAAEMALSHSESGRDLRDSLTIMAEIDDQILSGSGLGVVSFLMQPIILDIMSGESAQSQPLETSLRLYEKISESAVYHLAYI